MTIKKIISFLFLFIFSSCSLIESNLGFLEKQTRHMIYGALRNSVIRVENRTVGHTNGELYELVDFILSEIDEDQYLLSGWTIIFIDGWMQFRVSENEVWIADGLTKLNEGVMFISVHECLWDTSLYHELQHVISAYKYGIVDPDHRNKEFWKIVRKHSNKIMRDNCPKDYERKPPNIKNSEGMIK